ncbi:MAG: hypothetical protein Q4A25_01775 [Candidatus Saccharibacteria bacterium]|nr:hypothetical protein [Candidatus Saccharibacteria bacterium]
MKKKVWAILIAAAVMLSATPVFGADEEVLEFSVTPVEEDLCVETDKFSPEAVVTEDEWYESVPIVGDVIELAEDVSANAVIADISADTAPSFHERYVSKETDKTIVEELDLSESGFLVADISADGAFSADGVTADGAAASKFIYYAQYAYQVNSDYDIIAAYVKGEDGKYASRMFFVYDRLYEEWLRYDYSEMAAETFLSNWEVKDGLYVPVEKMSGDKKVWHTDNSKTAIDEGKIPVIAEVDVAGINYAWKSLTDIPFAKNGSSYEYAGEGKEEEDPKPDPEPDPKPVVGDRTAETDINGHHYIVIWTGSLSYNGMAHVWNQTKVSAKNAKKQVADLKVEVLRDGALVDVSNYSVTCKNNVSITGVNGNKKYQPYFSITLKGTYKKDNAKMSKAKLPFDITPCSVSHGKFQAKKVVIQGNKTTFTNLYFVFSDGRRVKLATYNSKKGSGDFSAEALEDGSVQITGYNNLSGAGILSLENPKKVTYEF